jgi:hypothetical protein
MVIVQYLHILKAIGITEFLELGRRTPPIVVVALENDLPAGNLVDPGKIRF